MLVLHRILFLVNSNQRHLVNLVKKRLPGNSTTY
jgi:hypothetical protein